MAQQQLFLPVGGDFVLNGNGGLTWASPWDAIVQNIERFLFTNPASTSFQGVPLPAGWMFHPDFGLGASAMIGQNFNSAFLSTLQQKIYQAVLTASSGNTSTPPVVTVVQGNNPMEIQVTIVITPTGQTSQTIQVTLP